MCYVKCMNQLFIYEWLQVKVILSGNETRWKYELNSAGAQTGQPKPDVLHWDMQWHFLCFHKLWNHSQDTSCLNDWIIIHNKTFHGANWSSWNCNLICKWCWFCCLVILDSSCLKTSTAAFSLNKWQHNHNALHNSESRQVGKTVTAPERTPTRPLTFKKNENKDQRGGQVGTQKKPPQTSSQRAIWWLLLWSSHG